jgi:hypothetical protein
LIYVSILPDGAELIRHANNEDWRRFSAFGGLTDYSRRPRPEVPARGTLCFCKVKDPHEARVFSYFVGSRFSGDGPPGVARIGVWVLKLAFAGTRAGVVEVRGATEVEETDAACSRDGAQEKGAACSRDEAGCWAVPVVEPVEIAVRGGSAARGGTAVELALRHLATEQGETEAESDVPEAVWVGLGAPEVEWVGLGAPEVEWVGPAGFEAGLDELPVVPVASEVGWDEPRVEPAEFAAAVGRGGQAARLDDFPVERRGG